MKKINFYILATALIFGGTAYGVQKMTNWPFHAPAISDPTTILDPAIGDILYDTTAQKFKGFRGLTGTDWVDFGGAAAPNLAIRSVTTTDTATAADDVLVLSGSSFTETLFTAAGNLGKVLTLVHEGTSLTNVYTIDGNGSETIGGQTSYMLYTNGEKLRIVSDGSGWQILDASPKVAYIKDVKTANSSGGTFTSGAYRTRDLNTLTGDQSFVSINSNQFTLQPGTYKIEASAPAYAVDAHKTILYDITNSTIKLVGSTEQTSGANLGACRSYAEGTFTIYYSHNI